MKLITMGLLSAALLTSTLSAKEGDKYLGLQWYGLSGKYDITNKITGQAIVGLWGYSGLTSITGRVNYKFKQTKYYNMYGYGSISSWSWSNSFYDETVFGFGAGAGFEYDIRGLDKNFIPLFISGDLGLQVASFDHYGSFGGLGIGLGVHYKF
ncbi:MAG: hypothetical protein U9N11_02670 [Campylobacterota bacterium]|nr:hypothetical protein [Campylobacterota bacterium]